MATRKRAYSKSHEELMHEIEPIKGSVILLIGRVIWTLILFEALYLILYYFVNLNFVPFTHDQTIFLILIAETIKFVIQFFIIIKVILSWTNETYYITPQRLIHRIGVLHREEDVYPFSTLRSVMVNQSLLGEIFNYGDITLEISASGGYKNEITLVGISNPLKYEEQLNDIL